MTEIEDTLSRALAAEADCRQPPVFNAYRIAEAATAKRPFWRRPLLSMVAAAIAVAGAGGTAVLATGGGRHRSGDAVTVTIQSRTGSVGPETTDSSVKAWVHRRAVAEGLKDVTATVRHNPWRLQVTGHAADLDLLKTFADPGVLQLRPTTPVPSPAPAQGSVTQACQESIVKTGTQWLACGRAGEMPAWVTDPVGVDYRVVASRPMLFSQGTDRDIWGVIVTFDDAGAKALSDFSARYTRKATAVLIDGAVAATPVFPGAQTTGQIGFAAGTGQRTADVLGAILTTQGSADLEGATVTVSTR
ncbi:hypothetical protein ABH926_004697 [Catenulispora sp. GP43]|uniref:hypothetical protein n=1 Tax=Catenulispora sp. GP43 TaxID=3156263 RepID=UPI0035176DE1